MLPVITIVGRPNVGKSTLFNYLTKSRAALVADMPGVTRDRQYGEAVFEGRSFIVVDTGGIAETDESGMAHLTEGQVRQAIDEADCVLFVVDARAGLSAADENIAQQLREQHKKVFVLVNKADHEDADIAVSEFHQLGFENPYAVSATRGRGIKNLLADVLQILPAAEAEPPLESGINIAIVGRPNVGKSTLINRMLGEERVVVYDQPGTTRDSIAIPFEHRGERYTLIDTAGVRRRAKVKEVIEKFSFIKTLQAIGKAHVVIFVFDAQEGITDQDLRLLGLVLEAGKGLILAINKWDGLDDYDRSRIKDTIDRRLPFADFARRYFISALHGTGVGKLYHAVREAYESASREISTGQLTKALEKAVAEHEPPLVRGRRARLRYAHLGGHHPMVIIVHGKQVTALPQSYQKYLANHFRKTFNLLGVPVIVKFKLDKNPYK